MSDVTFRMGVGEVIAIEHKSPDKYKTNVRVYIDGDRVCITRMDTGDIVEMTSDRGVTVSRKVSQ